jgi:hypothetical protein
MSIQLRHYHYQSDLGGPKTTHESLSKCIQLENISTVPKDEAMPSILKRALRLAVVALMRAHPRI